MKSKSFSLGCALIFCSVVFALIYILVIENWHRDGGFGLVLFVVMFLISGMILVYNHFENKWG